MKNVAKCDTWCELQDPVNHRVFERKLRPKPLGQGHACLGVTRCVAPHSCVFLCVPRERGGEWPSVCPCGAVGLNTSLPTVERHSRWWFYRTGQTRALAGLKWYYAVRDSRPLLGLAFGPILSLRPQVRRDYPLSLSISISGGKETYQDSLSSGERTGISPA